MNVNRVPAGVPTGGQFAPTNHVESDLQLDQTTTDIDITADITDGMATLRTLTITVDDLACPTPTVTVDDVAAACERAITTDGYDTVVIDADGGVHATHHHFYNLGSYWHEMHGPVAQVIDIRDHWDDYLDAMDPRDAARELAETAIELGYVAEAARRAGDYANEFAGAELEAIDAGDRVIATFTDDGHWEQVDLHRVWVKLMGRRRADRLAEHVADTVASHNDVRAQLIAAGIIK